MEAFSLCVSLNYFQMILYITIYYNIIYYKENMTNSQTCQKCFNFLSGSKVVAHKFRKESKINEHILKIQE